MKVIFKDVGQGDSIILEWEHEGQNKVGLIDCNIVGGQNPVLNYFKESGYKEVEFIILSHPHTDHFSGFPGLFSYFLEQGIQIKLFLTTIDKIGVDYWKYFEVDNTSLGALDKMMDSAEKLYSLGLLEYGYPAFGHEISLSPGCYLKFLAPHKEEILECQRIMDFEHDKKKRSKAANFLSTVLKIRIFDNIILLTSDAEKMCFQRILDRNIDIVTGKTLLLAQAPHHGSFNNHEEDFWSQIEKAENSPVVTSAGDHKKYKHPHYSTLASFNKLGYQVHSTSLLYGMEEFLKEITAIEDALDSFSDLDEERHKGGDKLFQF